MAFDGTEGGEITLSQAADMTEEYRRLNPRELKGHFIGKDILHDILDASGCMGIRIYYGTNQNDEKEIVLVGAESSESDMTDMIAGRTIPCPKRCGAQNDLNS